MISHDEYVEKIFDLISEHNIDVPHSASEHVNNIATALVEEDARTWETYTQRMVKAYLDGRGLGQYSRTLATPIAMLADWRYDTRRQRLSQAAQEPTITEVAPTPTPVEFDREKAAHMVRTLITSGSVFCQNVDAQGFAENQVTAILQASGIIDSAYGSFTVTSTTTGYSEPVTRREFEAMLARLKVIEKHWLFS